MSYVCVCPTKIKVKKCSTIYCYKRNCLQTNSRSQPFDATCSVPSRRMHCRLPFNNCAMFERFVALMVMELKWPAFNILALKSLLKSFVSSQVCLHVVNCTVCPDQSYLHSTCPSAEQVKVVCWSASTSFTPLSPHEIFTPEKHLYSNIHVCTYITDKINKYFASISFSLSYILPKYV